MLSLSLEERYKASAAISRDSERKDGTFAPGSLTSQADMRWYEEAAVVIYFSLLLGIPICIAVVSVYMVLFSSWASIACFAAVTLALSMHPLPKRYQGIVRGRFSLWVYRYFSFRMIVEDPEAVSSCEEAWVGASPPHGVLPIANVLSMLGINTFIRPFVGGAASVVKRTPGLRYMSLFGGIVDVGAKSMRRTVESGVCVGIVPDGVAGTFQTNEEDEVVKLKTRKGLAKFALKTGTTLIPAYSLGNTQIYKAVYDRFGVMEWLSRKLRATLLWYYGRWYLPGPPLRVNVTMLVGAPIKVQKVKDPNNITDAQIDEVHDKLLGTIQRIFDKHKAAVGWSHKKLRFV